MDCTEFRSKLDAYIDGELSEAERADFIGHARVCRECAAEIETADKLRALMSEMASEITPPIEAQAAWRRAVKREKKIKSFSLKYRYFAAVAAALVLLLGGSAYFGLFGGSEDGVKANNNGGFVFAAVDGSSDAPIETASESVSMASVKLVSNDLDKAAASVVELASEFNGSEISSSITSTAAYVTASIPANEFEAFSDALNYVGDKADFHVSDTGDGMISVSVTIKGE